MNITRKNTLFLLLFFILALLLFGVSSVEIYWNKIKNRDLVKENNLLEYCIIPGS